MIFRRKKFELSFKKTRMYTSDREYNEITDRALMYNLLELQSKYDFDIVSVSFCNITNIIKIKCNKKDKNKIFSEYCMKMGTYIEHVSF